jgi:8-oxo-dGTP diphosphatase
MCVNYMKKNQLVFDVVGALIVRDGRYLVCKRMENDRFGSLWEFPGGKVEEGEDKISALRREIQEELGVDITVEGLIGVFEDEIPEMKIRIYLFSASIAGEEPRCLECQDLKWALLDEIETLELAPADKKIFLYLLEKSRS